MNVVSRLAVSALLVILAGPPALAHHIWLEADGQTVRLYFGEFGENLREVSPGALDKLQPRAKVSAASGEQPLAVEKSPDSFVLKGRIAAPDSIVAEDARYPIFVRTQNGVTTRSGYWPAARLVTNRAAQAALLELDILPSGPDRFQVVFKSKPLAKAKVSVLTPFGWTRELQTGEDGQVSLSLPWRGQYVLEVHHADKTPGKRGEESYDAMNYVTSLTVTQAEGLEPPPSLAPAKPH